MTILRAWLGFLELLEIACSPMGWCLGGMAIAAYLAASCPSLSIWNLQLTALTLLVFGVLSKDEAW